MHTLSGCNQTASCSSCKYSDASLALNLSTSDSEPFIFPCSTPLRLLLQPLRNSTKAAHLGVICFLVHAPNIHTPGLFVVDLSRRSLSVPILNSTARCVQVVGGSQGAQVKLSDGSVKTVTAAAGHLSKPGTTTLRMTGGVITAASSTPGSVGTPSAAASQQQASFTVIFQFDAHSQMVRNSLMQTGFEAFFFFLMLKNR